MATMVWRYGLLGPTTSADAVHEQLRAGHEYRNVLTELVRARRAAERDLEPPPLRKMAERVCNADAECSSLASLIKVIRAIVGRGPGKDATDEQRRNRAEGRELQQQLREKRAALKALRGELRQARRDAKPAMQDGRDAISERWKSMRNAVRAHYSRSGAGLRHGVYTLVESELDQACGPLWDGHEPSDPRFSRWTGEGTYRVQIQGGCPLGKLGTHTQIQIDEVSCDSKARMRAVLRLRIGTDPETRGPIWAEWPMLMHRPIPAGAQIQEASAHLVRTGPRERWHATLTLRLPDGWRRESCGVGMVGVRFGWSCVGTETVLVRRDEPGGRRKSDERVAVEVPQIRAAEWIDETGETGELVLPGALVERWLYTETIRSIRDKRQDEMRAELVAWLDALTEYPEWMPTVASLRQTRNPARFASLLGKWRHRRWDGDGVGFELLDAWAAKDRHLWEWEAHQRQRAIRWRQDLYRKTAAALARQYGAVAMARIDWSELARKGLLQAPGRSVEARDDGQDSPQHVRHHRVIASPGTLEQAIRQAMATRGGASMFVDAKGCSSASEALARGLECERFGAAESAVGARKRKKANESAVPGETRWARARRLRVEKEARMAAARETESKCA